MSSPQNREEVLFALLLEKPSDKRAAFLDAMCEGDPALRQRLEARLTALDAPAAPPASAAPELKATIKLNLADDDDEAVGQTIGRFKLLEKIGEGGCGVVCVATVFCRSLNSASTRSRKTALSAQALAK